MRPIDADALIEKCGGWYVEEGTESGFIGTLKNLLAAQPTIQPEPKEGHWIEGGIYRDVIECYCSKCGQLMTTAATVRMNYCPNCGAHMKGERQK